MQNHLQYETSPYLLQHAGNPVDWYPWGREAFEKAEREDKPIFLSIGYSTCHWCHVMARESFEDEEIAAVLNAHFVSVKVDREERPDIDSVYMAFCQAFTGSGGWPTSIFMTPEQKPFFAGTYFPARSQRGMLGFLSLLRAIAKQWEHDRSPLLLSAHELTGRLQKNGAAAADIQLSLPKAAFELFSQSFDEEYGGFGGAPKFPAAHNLLFLLAYSQLNNAPRARAMAETTLIQMRKGGIFDQIGYGFSRYSTDRRFLIPHFEKMLYDNALLIAAYATAYAVTNSAVYLDTAEKTAAYILREMTAPEGGFYAAQDADSNGVEGKYYRFGYDEILSVLGEKTGREFNRYYGITPKGNFEGANIPNRLHGDEAGGAFGDALQTLYEYRRKRGTLSLDGKTLTAWNALMIMAFALLYRVTGKLAYLTAARNAQRYIEEHMTHGNQLFASRPNGGRAVNGFLDDYAFYIAALIGLYETEWDELYLSRAQALCQEAMEQFQDPAGGFSLSGRDNERLVLTPKEVYDGAMPSGNSMMAYDLVRLSQLTRKPAWEQKAKTQLSFLSGEAQAYPAGHSMFMLSLLLYENPPPSITVVLPSPAHWNEAVQRVPLYADVTVLLAPAKEYPLLNGRVTYYVCRGRTCLPPSNTL